MLNSGTLRNLQNRLGMWSRGNSNSKSSSNLNLNPNLDLNMNFNWNVIWIQIQLKFKVSTSMLTLSPAPIFSFMNVNWGACKTIECDGISALSESISLRAFSLIPWVQYSMLRTKRRYEIEISNGPINLACTYLSVTVSYLPACYCGGWLKDCRS